MKTRCSPCQLLCCDSQPVGYAQTPLCLTHVLPCNPVFQMLISGGVLLPKILRGRTDPRKNYEVDETWVHPCLSLSPPPRPPVSTVVTHHSDFPSVFRGFVLFPVAQSLVLSNIYLFIWRHRLLVVHSMWNLHCIKQAEQAWGLICSTACAGLVSWSRDWACAPCIARRTLHHGTISNVSQAVFESFFYLKKWSVITQ